LPVAEENELMRGAAVACCAADPIGAPTVTLEELTLPLLLFALAVAFDSTAADAAGATGTACV
jgi:hypothetical protein